MCGVCAWCVLCVRCDVCVVCVWRGLARGKKPVCRFKTSPCVGSKRFRVCLQNAHVEHMRAFCRYTRKRFEPTHGDVLNLHTWRREGRGGGVLFYISLSSLLSFSLPSSFSLLSFSSFVLFLFFFSLLVTITMITRPIGSLCVHTALTCLSVRVPVLWLIPCQANMFASCKKQLSWYNCASLVTLGMKWACICAGNECCVWLCV